MNFDVTGPVIHTSVKSPANPSRTDASNHNRVNESRLFPSSNWRDLGTNEPFYAQVNLLIVELTTKGWHGSSASPFNGNSHPARIDPGQVVVPPYYPDHAVVRKDWAGYLDCVCGVDTRVGMVLDQLEKDSLADDTVVVFFAQKGVPGAASLQVRTGTDYCSDLRFAWQEKSHAGTSHADGDAVARRRTLRLRSDPHELTNLATSDDPKHQWELKELRGKLDQWMEETGDLGETPESPSVVDHWGRDAARRHGTPDWYNPAFGTANQVE